MHPAVPTEFESVLDAAVRRQMQLDSEYSMRGRLLFPVTFMGIFAKNIVKWKKRVRLKQFQAGRRRAIFFDLMPSWNRLSSREERHMRRKRRVLNSSLSYRRCAAKLT